jgi:hypothetical protein
MYLTFELDASGMVKLVKPEARLIEEVGVCVCVCVCICVCVSPRCVLLLS